jgi:hypothetical protein
MVTGGSAKAGADAPSDNATTVNAAAVIRRALEIIVVLT